MAVGNAAAQPQSVGGSSQLKHLNGYKSKRQITRSVIIFPQSPTTQPLESLTATEWTESELEFGCAGTLAVGFCFDNSAFSEMMLR